MFTPQYKKYTVGPLLVQLLLGIYLDYCLPLAISSFLSDKKAIDWLP